jgi:hypothetical protein
MPLDTRILRPLGSPLNVAGAPRFVAYRYASVILFVWTFIPDSNDHSDAPYPFACAAVNSIPLKSRPESKFRMKTILYKIAPVANWNQALQSGYYAGSADDIREGFIHLSAQQQLRGILENISSVRASFFSSRLKKISLVRPCVGNNCAAANSSLTFMAIFQFRTCYGSAHWR